VIAIDNAPKMVKFGSKLARKHGFKNLEYRLGDIRDPPIAKGNCRSCNFQAGAAPRPAAAAHAGGHAPHVEEQRTRRDFGLARPAFRKKRANFTRIIGLGSAKCDCTNFSKKVAFVISK
jgi:hypothetical protein